MAPEKALTKMRLHRRRDGQQWILDWLVKTTGRVQNFANDERTVPEDVKSYRMIPRVLYKVARHQEGLARAAQARGHVETAAALFWQASQTYREAQHAIFEDDHPEKIFLYEQCVACYDAAVALARAPVERVEVPWEGAQIAALFHRAPAPGPAPAILFIPGMDMTKEAAPSPLQTIFARRGMHVLAIDGPGQGQSNFRKIRVTADNYERAAKAAIDWLAVRPEVDRARIGVCGTSFGSHWGPRLAAIDPRVAALATTHAVHGSKRAIFEEASPRFKQMFMYMAGLDDEGAFDRLAEAMSDDEHARRVRCPTLLVAGEYDPLCHLEDVLAFYARLAGPKELWVFENEFHRVSGREGIGGLEIYPFLADWLRDALGGRIEPGHNKVVLVPQKSGLGPYGDAGRPLTIPGRMG